MHPPETFAIGELAERAGLSVKLVRHWSDVGVIHPSARTQAGYRRYDAAALARLDLARTLRDLGFGLDAIRAVLDRERAMGEVAAVHADALEVQIRTLRLQQVLLRAAAARDATAEEVALLADLARMSADERHTLVHDFLAGSLDGVDVPAYRRAMLAASPRCRADPTVPQIAAWVELAALLRDPELGAGLRRIAEYAAAHAPAEYGTADVRAIEELTNRWVREVGAAIAAGPAADSPSAEPVVAGVVAAWLPLQAAGSPAADGGAARALLLEQLEVAADARVERYWQLVCLLNGAPVRPSIAAEGAWLTTALRANPKPGARAAALEPLYGEGAEAWAAVGGVLRACARVLDEVGRLVAAVGPERFGDPTPCSGWDVRALLDHLVWDNLLWTSLATGAPRTDVSEDHLGRDHAAAFATAAAGSLGAFSRPGLLEKRFGPAPGWRMVEQVVIEMLVHGWDLAAATGQPTDLAPDVAEAALPVVRAIYGQLPRTPGGSFARERQVPNGAGAADRLAAYLGRSLDA